MNTNFHTSISEQYKSQSAKKKKPHLLILLLYGFYDLINLKVSQKPDDNDVNIRNHSV